MQALNAMANSLICLGGLCFYVMLFTKIGNAVKQIDQFSKLSYYTIKTSLALVIAGSLLNLLMLTRPPFSEVLMNIGFGFIFAWAALWHGRKFGVLTGVTRIDRKTGTFPVVK